jgi:antimicrobial peptide system SdpB family protein
MTIDMLFNAWNGFFFAPVSVYPIALFRIVFGCVLLLDAIYVYSNAKLYLGPAGLTEYHRYFKSARGQSMSLFLYLPGTMKSVHFIMIVHFIAVIMLILGLFTPISVIIAFITTRSIVSRGAHLTNGGDAVAKVMCFLLIFTPCGQALSLDSLLFNIPQSTEGTAQMQAPWAQRLMQIQLCFIYFNTMYWKLKGATWRNGTAVYYAVSNEMYRLFKFPDILLNAPMVKTMTWGVLVLEFVLAPGLWIEELRPWLMASAVLMHLGFMLFLNIHLFSLYMIAALFLFLDASIITSLIGI